MEGLKLDLASVSLAAPTPRALPSETPRRRATRKLESLRAAGSFTQDVQEGVSRILQNALACGAMRATVQTMRIDRQYTFVFRDAESVSDSHRLYDVRTLAPIEGARGRVRLAAGGAQLVEWLRSEQGLEVRVCTLRTGETQDGWAALADWVQLVVLWVPVRPVADGKITLATLFNTQFADKALDSTAQSVWMQRLARAQACGQMHMCLGILYRGADFGRSSGAESEVCRVREVVRHPTLVPLEQESWALSPRLGPLARWAQQLGYTWALAVPESPDAAWALMVLWLDPLSTYV